MKTLSLAFVLALALTVFVLAKVPAYAQNQNGCGPSGNTPNKCGAVAVPEPDSYILLAAGLAAVGGLAFVLKRKQAAQN